MPRKNYDINDEIANTPIKPITEIIVSRAHHVRTVSLTVKPKNSLNSQKTGSFGGLIDVLYAGVARKIPDVYKDNLQKMRAAIAKKKL